MNNWIKRNLKNIIVAAFIIPILLVAFVSISHVTSFYGISNPFSWALYLSVGIEIAALSALAAVSVKMGRFIYIPFLIVTLIQMIGNVFFSFSYIDETSEIFKDWISMVGGMFENMGIEPTNIPAHKFILSFLTGGLLPIISLTFAHMLVKYSEQNSNETKDENDLISFEEYEKTKKEYIEKKIQEEDKIRYKPTEEDLKKFEQVLAKYENTEREYNQGIKNEESVKDNTGIKNHFVKWNDSLKELGKKIETLNNLTDPLKEKKYENKEVISQKNKNEGFEQILKPKISVAPYINLNDSKKKITKEESISLPNIEKQISEQSEDEKNNKFIEEINYSEPSLEIVNPDLVNVNLNEEEQTKIEDDPLNFSQPNTIESEDSKLNETEVNIETTEEEPKIQEVKPEPITPNPNYKVLNYFKQ